MSKIWRKHDAGTRNCAATTEKGVFKIKKLRKILSIVLAMALMLTFSVGAVAAEGDETNQDNGSKSIATAGKLKTAPKNELNVLVDSFDKDWYGGIYYVDDVIHIIATAGHAEDIRSCIGSPQRKIRNNTFVVDDPTKNKNAVTVYSLNELEAAKEDLLAQADDLGIIGVGFNGKYNALAVYTNHFDSLTEKQKNAIIEKSLAKNIIFRDGRVLMFDISSENKAATNEGNSSEDKPITTLCITDKNGDPAVNARVNIKAPNSDQKGMETYTNSLGKTSLDDGDNFNGYDTYGNYTVCVTMPHPNKPAYIDSIYEEIVFKLTPQSIGKTIDIKLKNTSTAGEFKATSPRVEITILDENGAPPPIDSYWIADEYPLEARPDIGGYTGAYEGYLDAEGKIYFCGMKPGEYKIYPKGVADSQVREFFFTVSEDEDVTKAKFLYSDAPTEIIVFVP